MKEVIAQEIVRRIATEVFARRSADEKSGSELLLYPPRTDASIVECAEKTIRLSRQALESL